MPTGLKRRSFLAGFATLGSAGVLAADAALAPADRETTTAALKIKDVQMLQITGADQRRSLYLKLLTDDGHEGLYGPIDEEAAVFVDRYFRQGLIGQDGLASETFWDRMFRSNRHSRGSHYLMGLAAVDNALWDLRGRYLGLPVYRLLGGSRRTLTAYASCLGLSQQPAAMQAKARELKQEGYPDQSMVSFRCRTGQGLALNWMSPKSWTCAPFTGIGFRPTVPCRL